MIKVPNLIVIALLYIVLRKITTNALWHRAQGVIHSILISGNSNQKSNGMIQMVWFSLTRYFVSGSTFEGGALGLFGPINQNFPFL